MTRRKQRGTVYRCPVCGAELAVLSRQTGEFAPRCCNRDMVVQPGRLRFYVCPICGAEIAALRETEGNFAPYCCSTDMLLEAA